MYYNIYIVTKHNSKMDSYNYNLYGYDVSTTLFIPFTKNCHQNDEDIKELKKTVDAILNNAPAETDTFKEVSDVLNTIVNGKTDNGKIDTFSEVDEALQNVEEKIPEMEALTKEEIIDADK